MTCVVACAGIGLGATHCVGAGLVVGATAVGGPIGVGTGATAWTGRIARNSGVIGLGTSRAACGARGGAATYVGVYTELS